MVQAKGKEYSMVELLGEAFSPSEDASDYACDHLPLADRLPLHSPAGPGWSRSTLSRGHSGRSTR